MDIPLSERRQIENEMVFRRVNERIGDGFDELAAQHTEEDTPELIKTEDLVFHFICECSDENCKDRIPIKLSVYQKLHENRKAFIVKPTHVAKEIEQVIKKENSYCVVEKYHTTTKPNDKLNTTSINNT